jgi:CO/xanthine dehydrogenase Mo-binding subunit
LAYQTVGKPMPRIEGADKVTGVTRYAADLPIPDSLYAKVLRSPLPHARIRKIDTSKARALPGVHAVLTGADLPEVYVGLRMKDMPVLARDKVRFVSDPVAAVAADTPEIADEALRLIEVDYEELPGVYDPLEAVKPGTVALHDAPRDYKNAPPLAEGVDPDRPNVQSHSIWQNGDIDSGFDNADRVFEGTFATQLAHHGYLEPHSCTVAVDKSGNVEVWASNKGPFALKNRLAQDLEIEPEKVNVHILSVGGDFGGKASMIDTPVCYYLAKETGRPVRMVLTYTEEIATAAHRHPAIVSLRVGVKNDGTLTAVDGKVTFAGGAYAAWKANPEITVLGAKRLASYYRIPAIRIETICAYTNQVPCTQTRTPGSPQIVFAVESQMGQIAREMGIDPADFRLRNLVVPGDTSPLGAKWDGILARETLEKAVEASGWRTSPPGPNRGRGIALYERGAGGGNANAGIDLEEDGTVTVLVGVPDVGPGIHTAIVQIVSETLGAAPETIRIRVEDTDNSPWDPGTGGSKSTNTTGHAAHKAAREVHEQLVECAARKLGCQPDQVGRVDGRFASPEGGEMSFAEVARAAIAEAGGSFHHDTVFAPEGQPPITSFAAQIAEVEVDPETGQVTVTRMTTAHDSGRILNHLTFQGQIDGGVVNGVGFALMEDNPMSDGRITTLNLGDFKLPCAKDIPRLDTVFVDQGEGPVPFQGKAIGELPNVPTAAAIANAVADATGVRVHDLPLTAEKVYAALHES